MLLMSSLTMVLAVSAAKRHDDRNTRLWLDGHRAARRDLRRRPGLRVHAFYREGLGFTTSLFGSSFYTLTGFHGVHVTVGIIMLMSLRGMIARDKVDRRQGRGGRARSGSTGTSSTSCGS